MPPAIRIENLSKKYMIKRQRRTGSTYVSLREVLTDGVKSAAKNIFSPTRDKTQDKAESAQQEFWALKDINLEVEQGDKLAIIGHNGAGKSTLLKVLSRITEPTTGTITMNGRIASLLEVGTGFHPELTGRENIFLNGSILGMSQREIKRKFDEIVDFAGVETFLDTPVKRYSSGMRMRLGFAVAAHLDSEILVIDEVLAVGDAAFQKKCLGKMDEVSQSQGRTILFVSHNMGAVQQLCSKGIILSKGNIVFAGDISESISYYLTREQAQDYNLHHKSEEISFCGVQGFCATDGEISFSLEFYTNIPLDEAYLDLAISDPGGYKFLYYVDSKNRERRSPSVQNKFFIDVAIKNISLNSGQYSLAINFEDKYGKILFRADSIPLPDVIANMTYMAPSSLLACPCYVSYRKNLGETAP